MSPAPEVSIIIPVHDRPDRLRRSLASALGQTGGTAIEVVVVDDGSDPPVRLADMPGVILIRTENGGAAAARNAGLSRSRGRHVLFLDSDDWLESDAVANLLATIRRSGAVVAFGGWRNVFEPSGRTETAMPNAPFADSLANAITGGWVAGSVLMSRAVAARFDPALVVWEVVVFTCDSLAGGGTAAPCEAIVVNVAQHAEPDRITNRHDHFEPLTTARIFAAMKARLAARGLLNAERIAALDGRLLPCLHALLRAGRPEAREVYRALDRRRLPGQQRDRPGSFAWCARWGGLVGARTFTILNRTLGR